MTKYLNKYRIESNRKPGYNYSADGLYFITFVTQNRVCSLGNITTVPPNDDQLSTKILNDLAQLPEDSYGRADKQEYYTHLSDFGQIIQTEWLKSFEIRTELFLDCYIIMPYHLHAIVEIRQPHDINRNGRDARPCISIDKTTPPNSTDIIKYPDELSNNYMDNFILKDQTIPYKSLYRLPKSLSSFIAGFKSAVNTQIDNYLDEHQLKIPKYNSRNHFFQPNYYDHIIRNEGEYYRIREYIHETPYRWAHDCFNDEKRESFDLLYLQ